MKPQILVASIDNCSQKRGNAITWQKLPPRRIAECDANSLLKHKKKTLNEKWQVGPFLLSCLSLRVQLCMSRLSKQTLPREADSCVNHQASIASLYSFDLISSYKPVCLQARLSVFLLLSQEMNDVCRKKRKRVLPRFGRAFLARTW